jgi:uncharacterized membrane protein
MAMSNSSCKIIVKPNNSLSPEASVKLLLALVVVVLVIALAFTNMGAWLVLPFAGLEIIAFAYAFYYIYLHSDDFESITIEVDNVVVEKRNYKENTTVVFQRYWAQVNVRDVESKKGVNGKSGLFIGAHGKEVEFGRNFINDEQRTMLARELRQKINDIH